MRTHAFEAGMVGIDIGNGLGRAGLGTFRITTAEITLVNHLDIVVIIHGAERAGYRAYLATDTNVRQHLFGAGGMVNYYRFDRTGMQTPGLGALGTGIGDETPFFMESEYLDSGFGWIKHTGGLIGTGHFTLQATGALLRFYLKRFEHLGISLLLYYIKNTKCNNALILYGIAQNLKTLNEFNFPAIFLY